MGIKGLQPETQGSTKQYGNHWALTLTLTLITTLPAVTSLTPVALRESQSPSFLQDLPTPTPLPTPPTGSVPSVPGWAHLGTAGGCQSWAR